PFSGERYFFPFRPVEVSPIGVGSFFSEWGLRVIKSELLWVWAPAALCVLLVLGFRRARRGARGR
nr:metal-dependent hydrolase [Acidobacteriota bacterium]